MFKRTMALGLGMAALTAVAPAFSAPSCAERDTVVERLQSKFSEQLAAGGLQSARANAMMEIWASPETGTYTVLITTPQGISCVVAAGTDFFRVAPQPVGAAS